MNLTAILRQSRINIREEYIQKEVEKRGVLRAGNSGVIMETGEVAGSCIRKAHLRSLGIELEKPDEKTLIMFDLGYANEDIITGKIQAALPPEYTLLREEQIPISWFTTNVTLVTGRPDIVICKGSSTIPLHAADTVTPEVIPVIGLELKSVHSIWTAKDVLFGRKPKLSNLCQAAHYMWKLEVPYKLIYTSYSQLGQGMGGVPWIANKFPNEGEPYSDYIEYNTSGGIKHLRQFEIIYDLRFNSNGILQYKLELESEAEWTDTIVSINGIESFYEYTSHLGKGGELGPRPAKRDSLGEEAGYRDCDYCPLRKVCSKTEKLGYDTWLAAVKEEVIDVAMPELRKKADAVAAVLSSGSSKKKKKLKSRKKKPIRKVR